MAAQLLARLEARERAGWGTRSRPLKWWPPATATRDTSSTSKATRREYGALGRAHEHQTPSNRSTTSVISSNSSNETRLSSNRGSPSSNNGDSTPSSLLRPPQCRRSMRARAVLRARRLFRTHPCPIPPLTDLFLSMAGHTLLSATDSLLLGIHHIPENLRHPLSLPVDAHQTDILLFRLVLKGAPHSFSRAMSMGCRAPSSELCRKFQHPDGGKLTVERISNIRIVGSKGVTLAMLHRTTYGHVAEGERSD
mmetsp:Transcript_58496/g.119642  ORF Transcript_58496/g.119642 Transcript_58496/m.119642 type:complete len:252 (+) Transcript_58496:120-875(+)